MGSDSSAAGLIPAVLVAAQPTAAAARVLTPPVQTGPTPRWFWRLAPLGIGLHPADSGPDREMARPAGPLAGWRSGKSPWSPWRVWDSRTRSRRSRPEDDDHPGGAAVDSLDFGTDHADPSRSPRRVPTEFRETRTRLWYDRSAVAAESEVANIRSCATPKKCCGSNVSPLMDRPNVVAAWPLRAVSSRLQSDRYEGPVNDAVGHARRASRFGVFAANPGEQHRARRPCWCGSRRKVRRSPFDREDGGAGQRHGVSRRDHYNLSFRNDNTRALEGELVFLSRKARPFGYALDVDGVLVDGVGWSSRRRVSFSKRKSARG